MNESGGIKEFSSLLKFEMWKVNPRMGDQLPNTRRAKSPGINDVQTFLISRVIRESERFVRGRRNALDFSPRGISSIHRHGKHRGKNTARSRRAAQEPRRERALYGEGPFADRW